MSSNDLDRKTLISIVSSVRPALATAAYIPALTHVLFDGEVALSYNDVAAIWVTADVEFEGCLPGELLLKALNSFGNDKVALESMDDGTTLLRSGRSKLKIPTLALQQFPRPKIKEAQAAIELDGAIIQGIRLCLMNVGNDPTHPAQMGVTLDVDSKGRAVLYSTDNTTISRYQTAANIKLPADSPVILPTFFCQQVVDLWSTFKDEGAKLKLGTDFLLCVFGRNKANVFSKVMPDLEALDFAKQMDKVLSLGSVSKMVEDIPNNWEACFQRAMLVLDGEVDKTTEVRPMADGLIKLHTASPHGESDDQITTNDMASQIKQPVLVDPSLILRASKHVSKAAFTEKVTVLSDDKGTFLHLIAHCSK